MLQKQAFPINFAQGLDLKTDEFQVPAGRFLSLQNSIFTKTGRLTKRNGFGSLTALPDESSTSLTTFNNNLTAIGTSLNAYSAATNQWVNKGSIMPISLSTLPLVRNNLNQSQADIAVASNGLICTVYTEVNSGSSEYKYVVADSITGQNIIEPTLIPAQSSGVVTGAPRVFVLGNFFVVLYTNVISATSHLQYMAISINSPTATPILGEITSSYVSSSTLSYDAVVANQALYVAYNTTTGGQSVKITYLSSILGSPITPTTYSGSIASIISVTADTVDMANPIIYVSFYDSSVTGSFTFAVDKNLNKMPAFTTPVEVIGPASVVNITSVAQDQVCTVFYEISNSYTYDGAIATNLICSDSVTQNGTTGTFLTVKRSVGLASKSFIVNGIPYILSIYSSDFQPTYFLLNSTGEIISKLAYSNGGSYLTTGLPNVTVVGNIVYTPYLVKDLVQAANKNQNPTSSSPVYSQTGVNLVTFDMSTSHISTAEIGGDLHISGGYLAMYDGYTPVEHGFFLYPDYIELTSATTGGDLAAQEYFYQVTYEWSDNQGNVFRSAPSIPQSVTTTGATSTVTINVPTLRLTYKIANPVKIVIYRWSTANQVYYQVTSIQNPTLNDLSTDSIAYVDTLADSSILGNNIIYTNGGVIEDIAAPATNLMALFNNRLFLVDAEDPNLLWFSKQVVEDTPVEMSDLLTIYVAPTTSAQGSTGPTTAIAALDDKLVLFKKNAIYYINGIGPDNTGANNQYSDATFITSTVGCDNQQSIVFTPQGLMFQSDKGIWLLGRNLDTTYIGAAVETLTLGNSVNSAVNVPGTNQVRFTLDNGITLMYDYYYGQWGSFTNVPAVSSTIYNGLHTYMNDLGQAFQETPNAYLDGSNPVLVSFTTGWVNVAGVQGYERFYRLFLLGEYASPFKLNVQLAYNYNNFPSQATIVTPVNSIGTWGGGANWGSTSVWGGASKVFEARVFPIIQKCESFQISVTEIYDATQGFAAGAGLTLSGLNMVVGVKKGYRTSSSGRSFG